MYVDVANDAKKMGAEHSQVLFPPGPVAHGEIDQIIVVLFRSYRQKQLYQIAHGHTFETLDINQQGLEWFEQEWHKYGISV